MNTYRERTWALLQAQLAQLPPVKTALDFGAGDGWFAMQSRHCGRIERVAPLDVKRRANVLVEPELYDGVRLPYADGSFELVYAIDVLHHCADPVSQLLELDRVASKYLLIKDHTYSSALGRWALAVLDELGNRRFGIPSPQNYQRGFEWDRVLTARGWSRTHLVHPAPVHVGVLGKLTNRLQYIACYRRTSP